MPGDLMLPDARSLDDLRLFLGRARRVDDGGAVRLLARGPVLAAYVGVLHPLGLLDDSPTVLGLRTSALAAGSDLDAVVPLAALLRVLERSPAPEGEAAVTSVAVPAERGIAAWAAISPPRGGWAEVGVIAAPALELVARDGIDEVAAAVPEGTGEQIVHRVRSSVWGRPVPDLDDVPAGAAFAALALGFLGEDAPVRVLRAGAWTRLTTSRGHVLVKRRSALG